jgi:glycosyltransferase involved in cell wall biosynthesis
VARLVQKRIDKKSVRVLIITYCFPPNSEVGSRRLSRFCNYLPEHGIDPVVLTVQEKYTERLDHKFASLPGLRVVCTPQQPDLLNYYHQWKTRTEGAHAHIMSRPSGKENPRLRSFRRQVVGLLGARGENWGWFHPAVQAAERLICEQKFDAMLSSGPPHVAHCVARILHQKYRIPWLVDFRDPWVLDSIETNLPSWTHYLRYRRERACVREADFVICNTDRMREDFCVRYPDIDREKLVTITNGFEGMTPHDEYSSPVQDTRELVLHLGSLYGSRRADTFCQALTKLEKEGSIDINRLRVLFVGDMEERLKHNVEERAPELIRRGIVELLPAVSWDDAQKLLWSAKVLLCIPRRHQMQVPAKFYEYLATGKPIFGIAMPGALTDAIELTASGAWAPPLDVDEIARQFYRTLMLPGRRASEAQEQWGKRFHFASLTQRLAHTIKKAVSGSESSQSRGNTPEPTFA